jgi:energy-converting hydrogenase Eha subunit B
MVKQVVRDLRIVRPAFFIALMVIFVLSVFGMSQTESTDRAIREINEAIRAAGA